MSRGCGVLNGVLKRISNPRVSLKQHHNQRGVPFTHPISIRSFRSSSSLLKKDFYEVLGVPKSSTKDDIKKKYRELAKKYHPDLNKDDKNAEKKFREVSEAHEVLENETKRQRYDAYGHAGVDENYQQQQQQQQQGGGGFGGFGGGMNINMEDLFDMFNGGGFAQGKGSHVETKVRISFMEAVRGCKRDISYEYFATEPIGKPGRNRQQYKKVRKSKKVAVDIPPGVDTGVQMCIQGQGADGMPGFMSGDLYVSIVVDKDKYYKRGTIQ